MTSRYREGRKQAGLSLGQGERITGIDIVRLSDIELDRVTPTATEQRTMADRYMCSVEWLRGDDVPVPSEFVNMCRDADISDHDRGELLRFAQSLPRNGKTATERLADKVHYVKRQGQTRDHHCHWPGCTQQVPPAMWGCKVHWFKLPKKLRDKIWNTYVPGQEIDMTPSNEYLNVADEVQQWIKQHGGAP